MKPGPQKKKPLLDAMIRTEFGDVLAEGVYADPERVAEDITYVPGFSEMRVERDKALGEVARGERDAVDVPQLPINLRWSRRSNTKGDPDHSRSILAQNMGYEPVNAETDKGQPWFTRLPEGAQILPGGLVVKGDTVLMKCSKERAAKNSAENFKRMVELGTFEFDTPDGAVGPGSSLAAMGGTINKIPTDGPIPIKGTGRLK